MICFLSTATTLYMSLRIVSWVGLLLNVAGFLILASTGDPVTSTAIYLAGTLAIILGNLRRDVEVVHVPVHVVKEERRELPRPEELRARKTRAPGR